MTNLNKFWKRFFPERLLQLLLIGLLFFIVNFAFGQDGKVTREVWTGISGTTIDKIPLTKTPNSTGTLTSIQAPVNNADNYGQRIKGYILPTTTGTYNLYISSDDYGELWLSTNDQVANKTKIASVSGWTKSLEWTKYTSQKSAAISLTAGQYYYFEALMKEGTGGDNLAIGWTGPGISSVTVIGASNISTTASATAKSITITSPTSDQVVAPNSTLPITVSLTGTVTKVIYYLDSWSWIGEVSASPYSLNWVANVSTGSHVIRARATFSDGTTLDATNVTFTVGTSTDTQAPSAPTALASASVAQTSFTLSWTASTDNVGVSSYEVFAGTTSKGTTSSTSLSITGLTCNTAYSMTVKAKDAAGLVSAASSALSVTTSACTTTARKNHIGVNVTGWGGAGTDYLADKVWADVFRSHRGWSKTSSDELDYDASLDANGWPTEDAFCLLYHGLKSNNNNGTYKLSFTCSGNPSGVTVTGSSSYGNATVQNRAYSGTTVTYDVVISATDNSALALKFTNTSGGVKDVKLMRPLTPGSTSSYSTDKVFTDQFKKAVEPFEVLRYMHWMNIDYPNGDVNWSDVTPWTYARQKPKNTYTWGSKGPSWESVIKCANETNTDVWICVPVKATDDYYTQLAKLFRDGNSNCAALNSTLKIYVEYGNEIWNTGGYTTQWAYVKEQGAASSVCTFDGNTDVNVLGFRYAAQRIVEISKIFRTVFGNDAMMTRIRPYIGGQKGYIDVNNKVVTFIDRYYNKMDSRSNYSDPHAVNYYLYGYGGTTYFYPNNTVGLTIDNYWDRNPVSDLYSGAKDDASLAKTYGLSYLAYEGGPHPNYTNSDELVIDVAQGDARMQAKQNDMHKVFNQVDGELCSYFELISYPNSSYPFGMMRGDIGNLTYPRYKSMLDIKAATPDAITLGTVAPFSRDGKDFNIESSWGQTPGTGSFKITSNVSSYNAGYCFRVSSAGTYNVQIEYSTTATATMVVEYAGAVIGTFNLANSGGAATTTSYMNITCSTDKLYAIKVASKSGEITIIKVSVGTGSKSANTIANQNSVDYSVSVYPNPATDYITINLANASENDKTNITLTDLTGKVVYRNTVSEVNNVTIATDYLTKGMYILNINNGTKNFNQKLIIK